MLRYPRALIRWFGAGLAASVIGVAALLVAAMGLPDSVTFAGLLLCAIGTTMVALTLLRGHDLADHHAKSSGTSLNG